METYITSKTQSWLAWFYKGLLFFGVLLLLGRMFDLQVIKGAYYRDLSEGNRIRRVGVKAPRGEILARGGEVLVGNREVEKTIVFESAQGVENEIILESERSYNYPQEVAHITGYVGEVNEGEVGKVDPDCIQKGARALGTAIGRSGLELWYDCLLRGVDGEELIEVDTRGKKLRVLGKRQPYPGEDIKTNIDLGLQRKVAEVMGGRPGVVIVTDTAGEVLALYSSPSYDPSKVENYVTDPKLPLFDRAIGGVYHPGSIFKLVTGTAALETGAIDPSYTYEDTGVITVNEFSYTNWYFTQYGGKEGEIDLPRALGRSTDTFFYKVGELVGIDRLSEWAEKFGLRGTTGIDLPGESVGLVPTPEWKRAVKGERWFLGNTYHVAIGQGDLLVTPIALNSAVSVIASGGKLCTPRVASSFQPDCRDLGISRSTIDEIAEGMRAACVPDGTAFPFFDFKDKTGVEVACKTGTAQTSEIDVTHAWFAAFAPADDPQIVVTVLVEKGGEGSREAAPIARSIFDYWFNP
jgi:penicillin-binding protein 2